LGALIVGPVISANDSSPIVVKKKKDTEEKVNPLFEGPLFAEPERWYPMPEMGSFKLVCGDCFNAQRFKWDGSEPGKVSFQMKPMRDLQKELRKRMSPPICQLYPAEPELNRRPDWGEPDSMWQKEARNGSPRLMRSHT
jgi:hypothetical protein